MIKYKNIFFYSLEYLWGEVSLCPEELKLNSKNLDNHIGESGPKFIIYVTSSSQCEFIGYFDKIGVADVYNIDQIMHIQIITS